MKTVLASRCVEIPDGGTLCDAVVLSVPAFFIGVGLVLQSFLTSVFVAVINLIMQLRLK